MSLDHIPVYSYVFHANRCKDRDYQDMVNWAAMAIAKVFTDYQFIPNSICLDSPQKVELRVKDLTLLGKDFFKALEMDKWMKSIDRMKNRSEERYYKSLAKRAQAFTQNRET